MVASSRFSAIRGNSSQAIEVDVREFEGSHQLLSSAYVFLISFGLFRGDMKSASVMDESGRHAAPVNRRGEQKANEGTTEMTRMKEDYLLADPRLIQPEKEYDGDVTVIMQTCGQTSSCNSSRTRSRCATSSRVVPRTSNSRDFLRVCRRRRGNG